MNELLYQKSDGTLSVSLSGRLNSATAAQTEDALRTLLQKEQPEKLVLNCEGLEYIASAGLRILLRLKKAVPALELTNVTPEVYEIFEMTGFTEMFPIRKAFRLISVRNCRVIGRGANGTVCRLDPETVVKVYRDPDALADITREQKLARTVFVLGIPTAIPYDVVRIWEGGYGTVFELLDAESLADALLRGGITLEEAVAISTDLLKQIHAARPKEGSLPPVRAGMLARAAALEGKLAEPLYQKLLSLLEALPDDPLMLHGDFHIRNIMVQDKEALLIDMDSVSTGHPIFELAAMYSAYCGYPDTDHSVSEAFLGIDYETGLLFWRRSLAAYLETEDEERIRAVEEKAAVISYARLLSRALRHGGENSEEGRREIGNCLRHLQALLPKVGSLSF